ncbi:MAG: transcription antitermination protein nusG [Acidobacteriaceae bacterium]|nr:transcription antitermination protein nusG [Acidobacteriaceae bacterium]
MFTDPHHAAPLVMFLNLELGNVTQNGEALQMATTQTLFHPTSISPEPSLILRRWYAAYTLPRHEKLVTHQLAQKSVECYLPLYEAIHRWKDRRARVQLPLFPGYVFVQIPLCERLKVLEIASVLNIVSFKGQAAPLPEGEIEALRNALLHRKAEPYPYLAVGKRVRVNAGPLQGLEGVVVRRKGDWRIVVTLDSIMQSVALEIDSSDVELAS